MILQNHTENITDGICHQRGSFKKKGKKTNEISEMSRKHNKDSGHGKCNTHMAYWIQ